MKTITLLNEKGGVGKTTLSITVAAGLARRGYRVLLVDADAQANGTSGLGCNESGGLYQLLVHEAEWRDVLQVPSRERWAGDSASVDGSLWVLSSNLETRVISMMVDDVTIMRERLDELDGNVDFVVIDTSPTPSLLHAMIYLATDYMIYPTQCELMSLQGLAKSVAHMQRAQASRKAFGLAPTKILGVQTTMYQGITAAHQHGLEMVREKFGALAWAPLAQRTVWREAAYSQQSIFAYEPAGIAAAEADELIERVVSAVTSNQVVSYGG